MGDNDSSSNYEKYDHSQVISSQLNRINKLISEGLQNSDFDSFDLYFHQVVMSLMSLDAVLEPFKDDEYDDPVDDFDDPMNTTERLTFVRDALREITKLLHREDLFYVQRTGRRQV